MKSWTLGNINISLKLGPHDDRGMGLVVRTKRIPLGLTPSGMLEGDGTAGGYGISASEASSAERVEYWPTLSLKDPDRRKTIYKTAKRALTMADKHSAKDVGFYTLGLEVARVPSWEVAEEIVRALRSHSDGGSLIGTVLIVTSSPTQMSSFEFALNNAALLDPW